MSVITRSNSTTDSLELVTFKAQPGLGNYQANEKYEVPVITRGFNTMFEAYTPNSGGRRGEWKDFEHYKMLWVPPDDHLVAVLHPTVVGTEHGGYEGSWYHLGEHHDRQFGLRGFGSPFNPFNGLPGMYVPVTGSDTFVPDPLDLDKLVQKSLSRLLPEIQGELSLVNSAIELRDFRSLPRTLKSLSSLPETLSRLSVGKKLREILRAGSDLYLQKKFNIDPLLSDISGLFTAVAGLEKQLNALLTRSAKFQRRHIFWPLHEFTDLVETYGPYGLGTLQQVYPSVAGVNKSYRQVKSETSKFHMMIEYNFHYTQYQVEHARLLALLDRFGVNLNPAIIWNAIPWSFVVDWVLGVSRWLDQFTIANMAPTINIRRCLWSISRERRVNLQYDIGVNSNGFKRSPTVSCGTFIETSYKRVVGMPSRSSFITSGLSSAEFSLGAALVLSRRRRQKRRKG